MLLYINHTGNTMLGRCRVLGRHRIPVTRISENIYVKRWNSTSNPIPQPIEKQKNDNVEGENSVIEPIEDIKDFIKEEKIIESKSEINDDDEILKVNEFKHRQEIKPQLMDLPWEVPTKKSEEIEDESTKGGLPWEVKEDNEESSGGVNNNEHVEEAFDPSKNELILAPLKKKSSVIQKLKPRKSIYIKETQKKNNENLSLNAERNYKNLMQFKFNANHDDFIKIIDELKPVNNIVTIKQLTDISTNLDKSFRDKQIREYLTTKVPGIILRKSHTKKKMINKLISEYWKLKVTLDTTADLLCETRIDLSNKRDLFLLLSNKGFLPQHWSLIGAQLSLGKTTNELYVKGSKNIVNFVSASWNDLLNNISTDHIDLTKIKEIYSKVGKKLDIETLQNKCGVHFDKVTMNENNYILSAIKNNSISDVKIELLKATEYRHGSNNIIINELLERAKIEDGKLLYKMEINDETLPWYIKPENYFRYAMAKPRINQSLLNDANVFTDILSKEVQDLKVEVEQAKEKFEYNYIQNSSNNKFKEVNKYDDKFFRIERGDDVLLNKVDEDSKLDNKTIEKELNDVKFTNNPKRLMLDNVINVKFGKLLHNRDNNNDYYFNENLPECIRNLSKLELMDKESRLFGDTGGIMNKFNKQLYIKLIPNGFWKDQIDKFIKYPTVELLIDLKDSKLEVNKFSAFISEYEKNININLPKLDVDLKFQNSLNSMLVYNKDQWILNGRKEEEFEGDEVNETKDDIEKENNDNNIIKNKKIINMFISQVGKGRFDIKRIDGLRGVIRQFQHKPYLFYFDKEKEGIKYCAIEVEYLKSIELEYKGYPVSLILKDNGETEKFEISMVKEGNEDMSKFIDTSLSLATVLSQ